jgi:FKBP-type peptidyl-prolyl cis-trans isomerase
MIKGPVFWPWADLGYTIALFRAAVPASFDTPIRSHPEEGMKFGWSIAVASLLVAGSAFAQDTTSDKGKISYAIGFQIGSGLADRKMDVDIATVTKALQDAYAKKPPAVPEAAMKEALGKLDAKMKAETDKALGDNKREADQFMSENKSKKGVIALPSGVQYRSIEDGTGKPVTSTAEVTFHVRVSLTSGREIRSSFIGDPIKAKVADMPNVFGTKLLPDVIMKMKVGDHWQIFLPPEAASGNQVFIWEVKIIDVK